MHQKVHQGTRAPTCDHCQRELPPDGMLVASVPDSSFVHGDDPSFDGWRLVRACTEHLIVLIDQARAGWIEEQLWFGRLARASRHPELHGVSLRRLAQHASLSPQRLAQALRWNASRTEPVRRLPGGHPLPVPDICLPAHGSSVELAVRHG